jgi:hypothetical protein
MTGAKKRPTRRNLGGGLSIPAAAEELDWPEWSLRHAVERGEVAVFEMAGLRRIPPAEIARLKDLSGK